MSMSNEIVAKRYAHALFDHAKKNGTLSEIEAEMRLIITVFEKTNQLQSFLSHPKITANEKKQMLSDCFKDAVSTPVFNTLFLMIDRKRGDSVNEMAKQLLALVMEEQRIAEAIVYSVKPLTDDETKAVSDLFADKVGKESLSLKNVIDEDLIGGLKIRVGNQIFDGSVNGKLERLKRGLVVS